jgi:hypothetical protein
MRRVITFLCLILLLFCTAGESHARGALACAGGSGAAACSAPAGSILRESFEGATPDNTWTAVTLTPTYQSALATGMPTGACTNGVNLVLSTTGNRERIYWKRGSALDYATSSFDIEIHFYISSWTIADGYGIPFVSWASDNEGGTYAAKLVLTRSGSTYSVAVSGASTSASVAIALETHYVAKIHIDATAASSYFQLTGGSSTTCDTAAECTFTRGNVSGQYLGIGKNDYLSNRELNIQVGYATIN